MKKQSVKIVEQLDKDIYKDDRNRKILVNFKKQKAYIIPKDEEKRFTLLQARFVLAVTIGILVGFNWTWYFGIISGILVYGILEFIWLKKFLPNLQEIEPDCFPKRYPLYVNMAEGGKTRLIVSSVAVIALPVVTILNFFDQFNNGAQTWDLNMIVLAVFSVALVGFSCYMAFNTIKAIVYLSQKEKTK